MTDFGNSKGSGHEQIRGRGFEALNTKSTWSSFDDITWDDFGGEDDHSVPDPEEPASQPLWLRGGRRRDSSRSALSKEEAAAAGKMEDGASMDVEDWEVAELGTVPDNLFEENGLIGGELKQESPDALLASGLCLDEQVFNEEDASIVTSSGGFSYVPTEEEMGLFGGENDVDKGGTLLGYAWDNLEDMGNLFQNEESAFGQDATDALIQWPSASSSPESAAALNAKDSSELRAMKGKSHDQDMKMEFIPCETFEKSSGELCASNSENTDVCANNSELFDTEMDVAAEPGYSVNHEKFPAEDPVKPVVSSKPKLGDILTDKTFRRQTSNRKRCEDRTKKQIYPKKLIIQPKQQHQPLTHYSSALVKPSVASSLQVYPAMPPPILGVNSAMPHRPRSHSFLHSSMAASSYLQQHPQPVMMCYEHADVHQQRQQQQQQYEQEARQKLEILTPSPVSGTNMTPQEKIEKLRWKQKMQRLASEQQQQISKQCITLDPSAKQSVQKKIHGKQLALNKSDEAEGRVLEAAVLNQLLTIMSKLHVGTRICIRDALYRLAKSAVSRNATDGASSSECSNNSAGEKSLSRSIRYPMLETETNPIDRTIANLLFHKRNAGTVLAVSSLPATTNWNSWQQAETMCEETTYGKGCLGEDQSTDDVLSGEGEEGDGESEGSSRRPLKMDMNSSLSRACEVKTPRSGLKREASCEFLSSQEDRGKGASIGSDSAKAAKTV